MTAQEQQIMNRLQVIAERLDRAVNTNAAALTQEQRAKAASICMRFFVTATKKLQELGDHGHFPDPGEAETFVAHFERECNELEQTIQVLN